MINNRQGGRRRGRGGGGGGGRIPNNAPSGNRQDHRQRGNAAQLLEKYRQLARDAQLGGDRVQTEYYLQFAEHYFRLLNENRARFEEQRRSRGDDYGDEDEGEDDYSAADGDGEERNEDFAPPRQQPQRDYRPQRDQRDARENREPRGDREPRDNRGSRDFRAEGEQQSEEGRARTRRPRRDVNGDGGQRGEGVNDRETGEARIALDILPPSIGLAPAAPESGGGEDDAPRPRRRTRRPRAEDDGDLAPAA